MNGLNRLNSDTDSKVWMGEGGHDVMRGEFISPYALSFYMSISLSPKIISSGLLLYCEVEKMSVRTKKLTVIAMMTAIAYIVVFFIRIPVSFLTLDPKSTVIVIAGFMIGPMAALIISVIVSFLEMITVSATGPNRLSDERASHRFLCVCRGLNILQTSHN